jgi:phosphopantothenoylcysteine decarboxylase/phosphopantothenate--cysteine ligase
VNPVVKELTSKAEHLSDDAPFDAYLVAPATYNTINKAALGIADTAVTTALGSAIGRLERGQTSVLIAPTMHGTLHNSILTRSLKSLRDLGVRIIPPRQAYGKHNIPETEVLTAEVIRAVSSSSLRGIGVLVTSGSMPVLIDNLRRLARPFRGRLGIEIARELHFCGAEVLLIHGDGAFPVPTEIPHRIARTYDDYRRLVHEQLDTGRYQQGIFLAGVADYRPKDVADCMISAGSNELVLKLVPTAKIVDEVSERHPELHIITFKHREGISNDRLIEIAKSQLERSDAVIAVRGEESGPEGEQGVWFLARGAEPVRLMGRGKMAEAIVGHLEHRSFTNNAPTG